MARKNHSVFGDAIVRGTIIGSASMLSYKVCSNETWISFPAPADSAIVPRLSEAVKPE